jgi:hypothetical protein
MVEEELGLDDTSGGVSSGSLLAPVPTVPTLAPVPTRSFVRPIPTAGANFDSPRKLYRGIFANC